MPEIRHLGRPISYAVVRSRRRTIVIEIAPGPRVLVRAPLRAAEHRLTTLVQAKAAWIFKHLDRPRHAAAPRHHFSSGDSFPYLGQPHTLEVRLDALAAQPRVILAKSTLRITLPPAATPAELAKSVRTALHDWYLATATRHLLERTAALAARTRLTPARVRVRNQMHRWGSCSAQGSINLNWRLVMAPPEVADYVIYHELCHLKVRNHSPRFWREVERHVPQLKERRAWLNLYGPSLHF